MTRHVRIKVVGFANGQECRHAGQYLKSMDFEAYNGHGYATFTPDPDKAMQFPNARAAMSFWKTQSKTHPLRTDGKPNRPLTGTTVVIE